MFAMGETVIPLADLRYAARVPAIPAQPIAATGLVADALGRPLRDLRISVTDRCNFRCSYCMPKEVFDRDYVFLPQTSLLSFEEITRLARIFVAHGVQKIRLTGGEPLLRRGLEALVAMLAELRTPQGQPLDLTLTTNGSVLARKAKALAAAGLRRITVSLDGLDDAVFRRMNDVDFPVADVLAGIAAAQAAGLGPIKVNMVVKRGTNEHQILPMARHFRDAVRWPGGAALHRVHGRRRVSNGWRMDEVLPSAQVLALLQSEWPLLPLDAALPGETAQRWRYADGAGEVGVISSVTQAFCGDCNRARLSTEGKLFMCLFSTQGHDLRHLLRQGASDADITSALAVLWGQRDDRYSLLRGVQGPDGGGQPRRVEMSYIGG